MNDMEDPFSQLNIESWLDKIDLELDAAFQPISESDGIVPNGKINGNYADKFLQREYQRGIDARNREQMLLMAWRFITADENDNHRTKKQKINSDDRRTPWQFIQSWGDKLFQAQFRITRVVFEEILQKLINSYPGNFETGMENYRYACTRGNISSGAHISLEIKLCITLRMLAGGSYLDMIWYGVSLSSVHRIFHQMVQAIDVAFPDQTAFCPPRSTEEFEKLAKEWSEIMVGRYQHDFLSGTVLAGDGLVVSIDAPTRSDRNQSNVPELAHYRNRKGCYALIVQAFCDAYGKFRYFECRWPGSTNDIVAYRQTGLYNLFSSGNVPSCYHMVLDEAYSSIGGDHHMCPFSKSQLRKANDKEPQLYFKMKGFNHMLSSQRITIERAFGMLVRRWGILWKSLQYKLQQNIRIIYVVAKLHNICIDCWRSTYTHPFEKMSDEFRAFAMENLIIRDCSIFMNERSQTVQQFYEDASNDQPTDENVIDAMGDNYLPKNERAATVNDKKKRLMSYIWDCEYRVTNVDNWY